MSRKIGQITARGERRWLVRVYLGRDRETRKRTYHNRTIYGSLRHAQAYLTRRLHERDLSRGVEGLALTVGVSPKVVSELLGHTSAAFTLDVYSHVLPHMQDDAAAKVEAVLMAPPLKRND